MKADTATNYRRIHNAAAGVMLSYETVPADAAETTSKIVLLPMNIIVGYGDLCGECPVWDADRSALY